MKKLLLFIVVLPLFADAQSFELGVNGGISFHSLPAGNIYTHQDKPLSSFVWNARGDLLLPNAQIGIAIEMTQIDQTNFLAPNYTMKVHDHLAKPLTAPYVFYNFVKRSSVGYVYGGLMVGGVIAKIGINTEEYSGTVVTGYTTAYNGAFGYVVGLQAGFVADLSKHFGVNVEAAMRYADYNYKDPSTTLPDDPYHYKLFYFPMTVGLRYRI